VCGLVGHEARRLRERFAALVAGVRFFARVRSVVRVQRRLAGERLVANVALERFVPRRRGRTLVVGRGHVARRMMVSLVQHQHVRLGERLTANVAHERPFARVRPPVTDHVVALDERLLTEVALVRFLAGVRPPLVRFHAAQQRESHVAHVARVRFFAGVRAPVRRQRAQLQKRLLAYVALEQLLAGVHLLVFLQVARVDERLVASVAFERLFPGVRSPVHLQFVRVVERPLANVAFQSLTFAAFLFLLDRVVAFQRGRLFRFDRARPVHFPDVFQQLKALVVGFFALGALELLGKHVYVYLLILAGGHGLSGKACHRVVYG